MSVPDDLHEGSCNCVECILARLTAFLDEEES
jgi:hypothetical protein